jgi:hypothetical protein
MALFPKLLTLERVVLISLSLVVSKTFLDFNIFPTKALTTLNHSEVQISPDTNVDYDTLLIFIQFSILIAQVRFFSK